MWEEREAKKLPAIPRKRNPFLPTSSLGAHLRRLRIFKISPERRRREGILTSSSAVLHASHNVSADLLPTFAMEHPNGTVEGLCAASSTAFALCVAFLAAWGFQGQGQWRALDLLVVLPLTLATAGFGFTPYLATRPVKTPERIAHTVYGGSVVLVMLSVVAAVTIEYGK